MPPCVSQKLQNGISSYRLFASAASQPQLQSERLTPNFFMSFVPRLSTVVLVCLLCLFCNPEPCAQSAAARPCCSPGLSLAQLLASMR